MLTFSHISLGIGDLLWKCTALDCGVRSERQLGFMRGPIAAISNNDSHVKVWGGGHGMGLIYLSTSVKKLPGHSFRDRTIYARRCAPMAHSWSLSNGKRKRTPPPPRCIMMGISKQYLWNRHVIITTSTQFTTLSQILQYQAVRKNWSGLSI